MKSYITPFKCLFFALFLHLLLPFIHAATVSPTASPTPSAPPPKIACPPLPSPIYASATEELPIYLSRVPKDPIANCTTAYLANNATNVYENAVDYACCLYPSTEYCGGERVAKSGKGLCVVRPGMKVLDGDERIIKGAECCASVGGDKKVVMKCEKKMEDPLKAGKKVCTDCERRSKSCDVLGIRCACYERKSQAQSKSTDISEYFKTVVTVEERFTCEVARDPSIICDESTGAYRKKTKEDEQKEEPVSAIISTGDTKAAPVAALSVSGVYQCCIPNVPDRTYCEYYC